MLMTQAEIATSCRARVTGNFVPESAVRGAGMDSRAVIPGTLFACIKGARADGHDYAETAAASGAAVVLAERALPEVSGQVPVFVVDDCVAALGRLASAWRAKAGAKVAAVTGTAGKTTVKEMLLAVLGQRFEVAGTKGNYNNQLGLPLTMLACPGSARIWVLELGISRPGDMQELAAIARPDLAVITNIGPAHLEGLGDLAGVARAKAVLAAFLAPGGMVLASRDYPLLWAEIARHTDLVADFSATDQSARFFAAYLGANCTGGRFSLRLGGEPLAMTLPFFGVHAAENLAAAAGAATLLGAGAADVERGLAGLEIAGGRFRTERLGGLTLIDDTYNANPLSMARSIAAAAETAAGSPLVLVLGEMRELGSEAAQRHYELGVLIAATPCRAVFFHGGHAEDLHRGLLQAGFTGLFKAVDDPCRFQGEFAGLSLTSGAVLFKGSRSLGMENFFAAAAKAAGGAGE
jgi:UDP-N-acetylmuramoyl-tripeptide--D-alanyl-D-alanine ligase